MSVTNKSYKSAICIIPPEIHWNKIQNIRKEHDKHYKRWMPHINLLYPFMLPEEDSNGSKTGGKNTFNKDDILLRLKKTLLTMNPFKIKLEKLDYFKHGKSNHTLWLKPETIPNNALMILEDKLIGKLNEKDNAGFPEFDDLIKIGNEGFKPHLSLGQFRERSVQTAIKKFSSIFETDPIIEFEVKEVYWITRKGFHDPFEILEKVEFEQGSENISN